MTKMQQLVCFLFNSFTLVSQHKSNNAHCTHQNNVGSDSLKCLH